MTWWPPACLFLLGYPGSLVPGAGIEPALWPAAVIVTLMVSLRAGCAGLSPRSVGVLVRLPEGVGAGAGAQFEP
jgi:hypothetical protein